MGFRPILALAFFFGVGVASSAQAHHRDFTFIRDWYLPFAGEREIESRTSVEPKTSIVQQEIEFELGISKHFAIEPGVGFHKEPGDKTHLDEWDVELRFNFMDFAYNKVLPALNIEYENPANPEESKNGKLKFIFSYYTPDGDDYSMNVNMIQNLSQGRGKDSEFLFGYSHAFGPKSNDEEERSTIRGGFEYLQNLMVHDQWLGPVVAFRINKHLNSIFTYLLAINHKDTINDQLKFIFEWEF